MGKGEHCAVLDVITIVDIPKSMLLKDKEVSSEENQKYFLSAARIQRSSKIRAENLTGRISRLTNTLKFVEIILNLEIRLIVIRIQHFF